MATLKEQLTGGDPDEFYDSMFVERGLVREDRQLPDDKTGSRGFDLSRLIQRTGKRLPIGMQVAEEPKVVSGDGEVKRTGSGTRYKQVKVPTDVKGREKDLEDHDDYGVVHVRRDPLLGWAKYLQRQFGTTNPFLAEMALATNGDESTDPVTKTAREIKQHGAETPAERLLKYDIEEKQSGLIDQNLLSSATPILIDPDVFSVVRSQAPVLDVIPMVAQAGYTASYNVIDSRDAVNANTSLGMQSEDDVDDLSGVAGQGFTIQNTDKDMKIFVDLANIGDFSQRAQSSLGHMDLEGTTMEARLNEYATFKAKQIFYGDSSQGQSDGGIEDSNAYDGLRKIADDTSNSTSKSGVSLSGDKALFKDIKGEIVDLVANDNVSVQDLHIVCSPQTFEALENEAQINVRLDAFDGSANFGGMTLSIMNVPVTADPNIRQYTLNGDNSNVGDVFIFDTRAVQFRALAPLFTLPLGRLGLADRTAIAEYGTLIDKSFDAGTNSSHTRVLEGYSVA